MDKVMDTDMLSSGFEDVSMIAMQDVLLKNFQFCWDNINHRFSQLDQIKIFMRVPMHIRITKPELVNKKFSPVILKAVEYLEKSLCQVSDVNPDERSINQDLFPAVTVLVNTFVQCVHAMMKGMPLEQLKQIPKLYLRALNGSYKYFKVRCGTFTSELIDKFNKLWTAVRKFEEALLSYFSTGILIGDSEEDIDLLCELLCEMQIILEYIFVNDLNIIASTYSLWKMYVRFIQLHYNQVCETIDVNRAISILCQLISKSIAGIRISLMTENELAENKIFECSAFVKLLIIICVKCDNLTISSPDVLVVVLNIYQTIVMDHSVGIPTPEKQKLIYEHLSNSIDPLVFNMREELGFEFLLADCTASLLSELHIPFCLLKLLLLTLNPTINGSCTNCLHSTFRKEVLSSLLEILSRDRREFIFSMNVFEGYSEKSRRVVSLYEYVLQRLCSFSSKICKDDFVILEKCLLACLFSQCDVTNFLASDMWCFLARYGPADVCYDHCLMLASIMSMVMDLNMKFWISFLLQRLFSFLSPVHKRAFIERYHCLPVDEKNKMLDVSPGSFFLTNFKTEEVVTRLCTLHTFISSNKFPGMLENMLYSKLDSAILESANYLLPPFPLISESDSKRMKMVLSVMNKVWIPANASKQVLVLTLLSSMVKMKIASTVSASSKEDILNRFLDLLLKSLQHHDPKIQIESLCIFMRFSFETSYVESVKHCLRSFPNLKLLMMKYLKFGCIYQNPSGHDSTYRYTGLLLQQYPGYICQHDNLIYYLVQGSYPDSLQNFVTQEDLEYGKIIELLNQAYGKIKAVHCVPLPVKEKINSLCQHIMSVDGDS